MEHDFHEGNWVLHHSNPKPLRVIGVGPSIAVQYPNGEMRGFEPSELKRVAASQILPPPPLHVLIEHRHNEGWLNSVGQLFLVTVFGAIWFVALVLLIAAAGF
jgi:hypothetical protein